MSTYYIMDKLIIKERDQPISVNEILSVTGKRVNIYLYDSIVGHSLDELFEEKMAFIVLLHNPYNKIIGHFTCFTLNTEKLSYFDSYGDKTYEMIKEVQPYIYYLYDKFDGPKEMNHIQYQSMEDDSQTCGRYTIVRSLLPEYTNDKFYKLINKNVIIDSPDKLITICTLLLDLINL